MEIITATKLDEAYHPDLLNSFPGFNMFIFLAFFAQCNAFLCRNFDSLEE